MNNNINLNLYRYFYEVAKYENFSKAANSLMISQPSLSYSIKVLEEQLNKQLFIRNNHKISLTNEGLEIYNKLKNIFVELDSITNNDELSGKVILGVRSAIANKILPIYINEINKIYPNLEISFIIAPSIDLKKMFENKKIDILLDEYCEIGDVESLLLHECDTIFFTSSSNYEKIKDVNIDFDYLKDKEILIIRRNKVTQEIRKNYPSFNYLLIQSTPLMLRKMEDNNFIAISPKLIIYEELKAKKVYELKSDIKLPKSGIYASYYQSLKNKRIKAVVDFFKEYKYF